MRCFVALLLNMTRYRHRSSGGILPDDKGASNFYTTRQKVRKFLIRTIKNSPRQGVFNGAPGGIRTHNLLIRSQMLYPIELRAHLYDRNSYYIIIIKKASDFFIKKIYFFTNNLIKWTIFKAD